MLAGESPSMRSAWMRAANALGAYAAPAALLIIALGFAIFRPIFLSSENLIEIVHQVSIVGIMAVGMTFVIMTGGIDLSVGSVLAVSGVVAADVLLYTNSNTLLAIAGGLSIAATIGFVQGVCVSKLDLPPIVVTLASLSIVRGAALLSSGPDLHLIRGPDAFLFIGAGLVGAIPAPVIIFVAIVSIAIFVQYRTSFGIAVLATGDNQRAAFLSGLNIVRIKTSAYVICASTAGLAGIIQASQVHTAAATYGSGIELDAIASVVLGGAKLSGGSASMLRTLFGVFLIGGVNNGLGLLNVPVEMQLIAKGVIIVAALLRPN